VNPDQRARRTTAVQRWIAARDGVVHSADVRAAGFSAHDIALAVDAGALTRIRRSWLATPQSDDILRRAASVSGRLTCVTLATARGLWVPSPDPQRPRPHIAVPRSRSRIDGEGLNLHWAAGPVPVGRTALSDPLLNVLFHVARCLPRVDALAVWESALRKGLTAPEILVRTQWRSTRAAELAGQASVLSDSGIETVFVDGMRALGLTVRQQVRIEGHRVDTLLVLRGYTILRFDYQQILFDWEHVARTVLTALAQGLHRAR